MQRERVDWAVAIFASRESLHVVEASVVAVLRAIGDQTFCIDLLINGNRALADAVSAVDWTCARTTDSKFGTLRLWENPVADKANAWNEYVHKLWPEAACTFFIDGYACVCPGALAPLSEAFASNSGALAASGIPSEGRSAAVLAKRMLSEGGIHGNLYALPGHVMAELRHRGIKLPRGIYRGDAALGAALAFGLDPARFAWDLRRIAVCLDATWSLAKSDSGYFSQGVAYFKRRIRQARGAFENKAIEYHLKKSIQPPEQWPATADELIFGWIAREPLAAGLLALRRPSGLVGIVKLRRADNDVAMSFSLIHEYRIA